MIANRPSICILAVFGLARNPEMREILKLASVHKVVMIGLYTVLFGSKPLFLASGK